MANNRSNLTSLEISVARRKKKLCFAYGHEEQLSKMKEERERESKLMARTCFDLKNHH